MLLARCGGGNNEMAPGPNETGAGTTQEEPDPSTTDPQDQADENPLTLTVTDGCRFTITNTSQEAVSLQDYKLEKESLNIEGNDQQSKATVYVLDNEEYRSPENNLKLSQFAQKSHLPPSATVIFTLELQSYSNQVEQATLQCTLHHERYPAAKACIHYQKKYNIQNFMLVGSVPEADASGSSEAANAPNADANALTITDIQASPCSNEPSKDGDSIAQWEVAVYSGQQEDSGVKKLRLVCRKNFQTTESTRTLTLTGLTRPKSGPVVISLFAKDAHGKIVGVKQQCFLPTNPPSS